MHISQYCLATAINRVANCHGCKVYIRVKNWPVGVKSLGGPKNSKNKPFLGKFVQNIQDPMEKLP